MLHDQSGLFTAGWGATMAASFASDGSPALSATQTAHGAIWLSNSVSNGAQAIIDEIVVRNLDSTATLELNFYSGRFRAAANPATTFAASIGSGSVLGLSNATDPAMVSDVLYCGFVVDTLAMVGGKIAIPPNGEYKMSDCAAFLQEVNVSKELTYQVIQFEIATKSGTLAANQFSVFGNGRVNIEN